MMAIVGIDHSFQHVLGGLSSDGSSQGGLLRAGLWLIMACAWLVWIVLEGTVQPRAPGQYALEYATRLDATYRPPLHPLLHQQSPQGSFAQAYAEAANAGQSWNTPSSPTPPSTPLQRVPEGHVVNTDDLPNFSTTVRQLRYRDVMFSEAGHFPGASSSEVGVPDSNASSMFASLNLECPGGQHQPRTRSNSMQRHTGR